MNLKNLTGILKSGNVALGQKLQNLLTEDCSILEYTDDAVLFQKKNYLVLAKFKHNLSESAISPDSVIDNEVISVSGTSTENSLKKGLISLINNLVEENYVQAEEELGTFCEEYYHFHVLRSKFPGLFTENLSKNSSGFKLRKQAASKVSEFKSELFSAITLKEGYDITIEDYTSILESCGEVLLLGRDKVKEIVLDAVLSNEKLAENITSKLFIAADTLVEANDDLRAAREHGFDLGTGKFPDEDPSVIASEDLANSNDGLDNDMDVDFPGEDEFAGDDLDSEPKEFVEFDPSKLSDEEVRELHRTVLISVLSGMEEFIAREANDPKNAEMAGDLDETLKADLDALNNPELTDEDLSQIEARWQPIISYFLDSDLYTPEQNLGEEEVEVSANEDEGQPIEDVEPELAPEDETGLETPPEPMAGAGDLENPEPNPMAPKKVVQ